MRSEKERRRGTSNRGERVRRDDRRRVTHQCRRRGCWLASVTPAITVVLHDDNHNHDQACKHLDVQQVYVRVGE